MVSIAFENFFVDVKNASRTFLRTYFKAAFNSKQISSNKHFSKMHPKARNGLYIDRTTILIPIIHLGISRYLVYISWPIFYVPTRADPLQAHYNNKKSVNILDFFLCSKIKWWIDIFCTIFKGNARPLNMVLHKNV